MRTLQIKKRSLIIAAALLCAALLFVLAPLSRQQVFAASGTAADDADKIEGRGYKTPEDAITAYAKALKNQDMKEMLSTFAVESYVDNYDLEGYVRRSKTYVRTMSSSSPAPSDNVLAVSNSLENRRDYITSMIDNQLTTISIVNQLDDRDVDISLMEKLLSGGALTFKAEEDGAEKIKQLVSILSDCPDYSKMKIGKIYYAEAVSPNYLSTQMLENMYITAKIAGADGFKSLAVRASLEDVEMLLFMDVIRYNGRWYNYQQAGMMANFAGQGILSGGAAASNIYFDASLEGYTDYEEMFQALDEAMKDLAGSFSNLEKNWNAVHANFLTKYAGKSEKEIEKAVKKEADEKLQPAYLPAAAMTYEEMLDFFSLSELKK